MASIRKYYISLVWSPLSLLLYCAFVFRTFSMAGTFQNFTWQHLMTGIIDQYYIIYLLLPYYCYRIFTQQSDHLFEQVIRFSSFFRYFLFQYINICLFTVALVSMHILVFVPFMIMNGQLMDVSFSGSLLTYLQSIDYNVFFPNAFVSVIACSLYMIIGLAFISLFLKCCYSIFEKYISFTVTIVLLLAPISALQVDLFDVLYLLNPKSYLVLGDIYTPWKIGVLFGFMILATILLLIVIKKYNGDQITLRVSKRFNWYISNLLFQKSNLILMIIIYVLVVLYDFKGIDRHFGLLILNDFWGYGTDYFSLIEYLKYFLKMFIPLYIVGAFLERELNGQLSILTIRLRSYRSWWRQIQKNIVIYLILYTSIYCLVSMVSALFLNTSFDFYLEHQAITLQESFNPLFLVGSSYFLMILELVFLQLLLFFMYFLVRNLYFSFIILLIGYMTLLADWEFVNYIPWGVSSIERFRLYGDDIYLGATITGLILLLSSIFLYLIISRRMFKSWH